MCGNIKEKAWQQKLKHNKYPKLNILMEWIKADMY